MSDLILAGRLILAAVFAVAAITKFADRSAFRGTMLEFRVPAGLVAFFAFLIPATEFAVAVLLVPVTTATYAAFAALGLLVAFSVGVGSALARGEQPDCGCFGASEPSPVGTATLVRNLGLAALAAIIGFSGPGTSLASVTTSATTLALAACVLAIVALAFLGLQLFQQNGRLLERVDALELAERLQAEHQSPDHSQPRLEIEIRNQGRSHEIDRALSMEGA